jgi:hypothetical protein
VKEKAFKSWEENPLVDSRPETYLSLFPNPKYKPVTVNPKPYTPNSNTKPNPKP